MLVSLSFRTSGSLLLYLKHKTDNINLPSAQDWHQLWLDSEESKTVLRQIDELHNKYGSRESAAATSPDSDLTFAASTTTQIALLTQRAFQNYWRDSNYIIAKIMLNIAAGLFIGFSFFKSPDNVSGLQNRLFAVFMAVVLAAPLSVSQFSISKIK